MIEYIDSKKYTPVFRDRELSAAPPVGAHIRFPNDKVWKVVGHMYDYHMNPELWICAIVEPI